MFALWPGSVEFVLILMARSNNYRGQTANVVNTKNISLSLCLHTHFKISNLTLHPKYLPIMTRKDFQQYLRDKLNMYICQLCMDKIKFYV